MTKRAVLYARVSGDDRRREDRNLAGQITLCREYVAQRGYEVVAELAEDDRGASGAAFELPRLNQVRELAQVGAFDVLVTRELDRLSRNLAKQLFVEEELLRAGVTIEYVLGEYADTPEGSLNKNIRAVIAEFERLKIGERMNRGRELKVKAGSVLVNGRPPCGYRVAERDHRWVFEVEEAEARVVRLIFDWYTQGDADGATLSVYAVQQKLNTLGVPSPADTRKQIRKDRPWGQWSKASIARILASETYAGTWYWRKSVTEKGKRVPRALEEQVAVEVPAIISRATWEAAVERRSHNQTFSKRNVKEHYLLRRRTVCGQCGSKMGALTVRLSRKTLPGLRQHQYYRCPANGTIPSARPFNCDLPHFRVDRVDDAMWQWVRRVLADPEMLLSGIDALQQEEQVAQGPLRDRLAAVEERLAEQGRQLDRLLDLYISGEFPKEKLDGRKAKLVEVIHGLEQERAALQSRLEPRVVTPEQEAGLRAFAAQVADGLAVADGDFDARRGLMDQLDVTATLAVEGGEKVVYARCLFEDEMLSIESQRTPRDRGAPPARRSRRRRRTGW